MGSKVLFSSVNYDKYDPSVTLPEKFKRLIDKMELENLIPAGVPQGMELGETGHLFERLHGKDPFVQLRELEKRNLGTQEYNIEEIY